MAEMARKNGKPRNECGQFDETVNWTAKGSMASADADEMKLDFSKVNGGPSDVIVKWQQGQIVFPDGTKW
eukprot:CAMPEP_0195135352 /NCGR_PEP_ID=MMETSP0448-20130528/152259_1 /TAXON_ID=66468 /ORGANISM="Heterocapsa triquestra, Strain CCMP 448" /LENGTH=69 /DNA_ID=CAMNT_0040173485 /DNA_START=17 /DNA_END=223 /DNA_ORIENTATION=+